MTTAAELDALRSEVVDFLRSATETGAACPAFGAIVPPHMVDRAQAWQQYAFDHGFAGLHWPIEHGGRGLTRAHTAVWFTECARARVAPYLNLQGIVLAGEAILRSGTPEQQDRFLRDTLRGDIVWCQLFSEPGAGSDLGGLQTRAELRGDRYLLNGQKVWSSNAQVAQFGILMARTDPDAATKHQGISFFLLDMTLPGIEVRPLRQMTGDSEFCEVFFTDVEMPADALLGPEHGGWKVAMDVLVDERGSFGEAGVISLDQRLDGLRSLGAGDDAVARDELVDLIGRGQALRALLASRGSEPAVAPAAKLLRTEVDLDANALEASLLGADALLWNDATERFLYSPGMRIAGGSSEIQRNILGERVLGLPREPR